MKGIGELIKPMVKVDSFIVMGMFMREIGLMIRPREWVFTLIWTVLSILESGKKINSMDKERKLGQMELCMKETMS